MFHTLPLRLSPQRALSLMDKVLDQSTWRSPEPKSRVETSQQLLNKPDQNSQLERPVVEANAARDELRAEPTKDAMRAMTKAPKVVQLKAQTEQPSPGDSVHKLVLEDRAEVEG